MRTEISALTMHARRQGWALAWLLAVCTAVAPVVAQPATATPAQVRAAYLHKFPGFVEWPAETFASPGAPIVIAVIDEDEVYAELAKLAPGRTVLGRPVEVIQWTVPAPLPANVQVLYIGARAQRPGPGALEAARRRGVLTVSDSDQGWQTLAALWFVEEDGRIRFDASPAAAERTGLKLSARLLAVARRVAESAP